ncbi:ABC transporter permease [Winogradskyella endarachnes]|uniref:Transport permease protein n=1 Tax=Winogradskyella endarachnes TaxID=2681965 RepID=A0A6L6U609_9FLAO|nr:ABC transporter permease [Winogradskyella endarachnes]MUU77655.1 ABC transporter permease [Winogradskyella endarachnes]
MKTTDQEHWLYVISSKKKLVDFNFKEIWRYKDLLFLFVKRDIITLYKQTVLGPLWYLIQPLFTSLIFTLIFNNLADIPTGNGVPGFLFNLAGITTWNYFKECLLGTSDTFKKNENIFGKVYFPRVIMPMSVVVSNLLRYGIQFLVFTAVYVYYVNFTTSAFGVFPSFEVVILPFLIFLMALLGLGLGMIISSMTTKYRDLTFLIQFGVQLLMYGSAVMYPMSYFNNKLPNYYWLIEWNPIAIIVEFVRNITLGIGVLDLYKLLYATLVSFIIFLVGLVIFNKTEKSFIDTI